MTIGACLASMGAVCAVSGKTVSNPRRRASWNRRVITAELYAWAFGGHVSVPATVTLVTDRLPSGEEYRRSTTSASPRSREKQSHANGLTIDLTQLILDISN